MLLQHVPNHRNALYGGKTHFYEETRIRRIAFNYEVINYKPVLNLLNLPPKFFKNITISLNINQNNDFKHLNQNIKFCS